MKKSQICDPYIAVLAGILVLNALLKWHFFCGLVQADDFSYGVYSYTMFRLPMSWDMSMDFRVLRLALLLPVSVLFRILPPSSFTAVLYPLTVSFGTVFVVYLIGRRLYGIHAGIFAAFILAVFPADVIFGTMLLPDIVAPFYMSLAVLTFLKALDKKEKKTYLWYLISGCSVFLAFNTRENSYYFLLFFLPFVFRKERWKRGLYLFGVGFVVPVIILYSIYFVLSGDFLFNLHLAQDYRKSIFETNPGYIPANSINWYRIMFYMVPVFFKNLIGRTVLMSGMYGYTFYIGIPCIIYTTIKAMKKRSMLLLIAPWWFLIAYLFLEFGTISFSHYQMMKKLPRFLLTLTPAMALGYGVVLSDVLGLGNKKIKKIKKVTFRWIPISISVVVATWLLYTSYGVMKYMKESRESNLSLFKWGYYNVLQDKPHKIIYGTGGWWFNKLSFYYLPDIRYADMLWRRSEMLKDLKAVENPEELAGSYIILDRRHFSGRNDLRIQHSYDDFGSYVRLPPEEWSILGSSQGVEIYEVPDDWTYHEPDGKELALKSLLYAFKVGDMSLFLNNLQPDFRSRLTSDREQLVSLIRTLGNPDNPERAVLLNECLEYKKDNGLWKIQFKLD